MVLVRFAKGSQVLVGFVRGTTTHLFRSQGQGGFLLSRLLLCADRTGANSSAAQNASGLHTKKLRREFVQGCKLNPGCCAVA